MGSSKNEMLKLTHGLKSRFSVVNWEPAISDLQKYIGF